MRLSIALLMVLVSSCSAPRAAFVDRITIEGMVSVRGNEPFTAVMLESEGHNLYVLRLEPADRAALLTPQRYRVTGILSVDEWNGVRLAFLDVERLAPAG